MTPKAENTLLIYKKKEKKKNTVFVADMVTSICEHASRMIEACFFSCMVGTWRQIVFSLTNVSGTQGRNVCLRQCFVGCIKQHDLRV